MRESRSPPSFQGEALADNSGGASLSFERGVIDVLYVLNVCDVPVVIVVLNVFLVPIVIVVLNVFLVNNVLYDPHVHNVIIVPHFPDVFFSTFFLFSVSPSLLINRIRIELCFQSALGCSHRQSDIQWLYCLFDILFCEDISNTYNL